MRRKLPAVVAVGLASALLTGCSTGTGSTAGTAPTSGRNVDPGVGHVHGLGVDPADGVLYAATHFGLFRLPERAPASRVADRRQDTMGFTVAGPGAFLGSGHPDVQKDPALPSRLGLIRSADAGVSWDPVSLAGAVDFHALRASGPTIYGWDAGSGYLLVSPDAGQTWQDRGRQPLLDLVVDPADAGVLLGATQQGLVRSTDGGRNWASVAGAPLLSVLARGDAGSLFGVAADGSVHRSTDAGATWQPRGSVGGPPEAATADVHEGAETLYVAVVGQGVRVSRDAGGTFDTRLG